MSKLLTNYLKEKFSSFTGETKDEIMKEFFSKEAEKELKEFLEKNKIKGPKSTKDPEAPKGAKNAYIIFCERNTPDATNGTDRMTAQAQMWDAVKKNPAELAKYNQLAIEDKERHEREMKEYRIRKNIPEKVKEEKNKTAFFFYKKDNYDSFSSDKSLSKADILKKMQQSWNTLKNEKSDVYKRYVGIAEDEKKKLTEKPVPVPVIQEAEKEKEEIKDKDIPKKEEKKGKKEKVKKDEKKDEKKVSKKGKKPMARVIDDDEDVLEEEA
jgi:hypothetical protein